LPPNARNSNYHNDRDNDFSQDLAKCESGTNTHWTVITNVGEGGQKNPHRMKNKL